MGLHIIDAKHFLSAVENAGSPLYCVDFVNLCRGDPHIQQTVIVYLSVVNSDKQERSRIVQLESKEKFGV